MANPGFRIARAREDIVEASKPLEILAPWQWRMRCYVGSRLLSPFVSRLESVGFKNRSQKNIAEQNQPQGAGGLAS